MSATGTETAEGEINYPGTSRDPAIRKSVGEDPGDNGGLLIGQLGHNRGL